MTTSTTSAGQPGDSVVDKPSSSDLADVIDLILEKGLVIDAYVRVSLVGIELLTIDARVVVASVETYLRFAEAVNRLDLEGSKEDLPELMEGMEERGAKKKTKGALDAAKEEVSDKFGSDGEKRAHQQRGGKEEEKQHDEKEKEKTS
jgi:gas vesicle structural protein